MSSRSEQLRQQVIAAFRYDRQLSQTARARYRAACLRFADVLAERTSLEKLTNLMPWHLEIYVQACTERGLRPATIRTDLAAIQYLHDLLRLRGKARWRHRLPTPTQLGVPSRKRVKNRAWTRAQLELLQARLQAENEDRLAAALLLAWELGLRLHEVLRLGRAQAEPHALRRGTLTIKGKGGRIRSVPLTRRARQVLEQLRHGLPRGQKLFVRPGETTAEVMSRLQRLVLRLRPEPEPWQAPLTFHGLRYTFAQRWNRRLRAIGLPLRLRRYTVSVLLGHSREDISDLYTRPRELRDPGRVMTPRRPATEADRLALGIARSDMERRRR